MKCDIIITYCWNRVGYNILKSLSKKGLSVICADTSKNNICSLSRYSSGSFTYPNPFTDEEEFVNCLINKINEFQPAMLIPTHDESLIIAKYRNRFPPKLKIPISNFSILCNLSDKKTATKIAQRLSIPVPKVYDSITDINENQYPLIIKPTIGNSAKGVHKVNNRDEADAILSQSSDTPLIIEEFIPGNDICVDCIRTDNFFYGSVYRAIVTKTQGGGTTTQREIVQNDKLVEYAKILLDHVGYTGVCGLDFRIDDKTGRIAFIETNPRFTGGLATPIAAGFDIPNMLHELYINPDYKPKVELKTGTKTKWILGDGIALVDSIVHGKFSKHALKTAFNFKGFDAFDDYDKKDRRAILGELSYYLSKLIKNRKLNP